MSYNDFPLRAHVSIPVSRLHDNKIKKNYNLPNPSQILVNHERYQWQKKCTNNLYDPVKISEKPGALIIASAFPLQMNIYLTSNKYT